MTQPKSPEEWIKRHADRTQELHPEFSAADCTDIALIELEQGYGHLLPEDVAEGKHRPDPGAPD